MNPEMPKTVPEPTLKRLPLYHRFLKELRERGPRVRLLHRHRRGPEARPDAGPQGPRGGRHRRPARGSATRSADVIDGLEEFLGWKKVNEAFLVGAGSMGSALLGYRKFEECGLKIVAAFDTRPGQGRRQHPRQARPAPGKAGRTSRSACTC